MPTTVGGPPPTGKGNTGGYSLQSRGPICPGTPLITVPSAMLAVMVSCRFGVMGLVVCLVCVCVCCLLLCGLYFVLIFDFECLLGILWFVALFVCFVMAWCHKFQIRLSHLIGR